MFSCEFCEISKNTFFYRTPLVAASVDERRNCFLFLCFLLFSLLSILLFVLLPEINFIWWNEKFNSAKNATKPVIPCSNVSIVNFEKVNADWDFNPFHATGLFYIPWTHQKTRDFLMFSLDITRDQLHEMG